jgi:hypothetical protein
MTVTTGWDLFEDVRAAQDEMLRAASGRGRRPSQQFEGGTSHAVWPPAVDISERKDAYLVQDGVLHILVLKSPDVKAKRIQVHAGQPHTVPT